MQNVPITLFATVLSYRGIFKFLIYTLCRIFFCCRNKNYPDKTIKNVAICSIATINGCICRNSL